MDKTHGRVKKGNLAALFGVVAVVGGAFYLRHLVTEGKIGGSVTESVIPLKVALPAAHDVGVTTSAKATLPGSGFGCPDKPEVRKEVMAWNAQMGEMFATGGKQATVSSLMCQYGVNYKIVRQDDTNKMQADLLACANEIAKGAADCKSGAQFVSIMGDGGAQFFAGLNPELAKLGKEFTAEVVGSAGYSRGEDKLMGPRKWKDNPQSMRGGVVAGVLRDGDWNISLQFQEQNDKICNNPDEKTYDPDCVNWVAANDFLDAAEKYISGFCEERPVVSKGRRTGKTQRACVDGVVTWTPGDVNIAEKKGGLVSIVSTRQYASQMPNVIIGIRKWNQAHRALVEGMLQAIFEGGDQVRQYQDALQRAGQASAEVYGEKDASYWVRYYRGVTESDLTGVLVDLGGSKVNGLADNLVLFGLQKGYDNAFAATYTEFGNLVVQQYPKIVSSYPPVDSVLDTSYVSGVANRASSHLAPDVPKFVQSETGGAQIEHRSWHFEFDTGKATFKSSAQGELKALARALTIASDTIVKVDGYTDRVGSAQKNQELSEQRAFAVRDYLVGEASESFPPSRFRVAGHGPDNPIASNSSESGRAQNRRVEITVLAH